MHLVLSDSFVSAIDLLILVGCQAEAVCHNSLLMGHMSAILDLLRGKWFIFVSNSTGIHFVFVALEKGLISHKAFLKCHLTTCCLKLVEHVRNSLLVD